MSSLDGRQRVREVVTLAMEEEYMAATKIIEEIAEDSGMSRAAMVYLVHLTLAMGLLAVNQPDNLKTVMQHVFAVSAVDEVEAMGYG